MPIPSPELPPSPFKSESEDEDPIPIPIPAAPEDSLLNTMIDQAYEAGRGILQEGKALLQTVQEGRHDQDVLMDDETGHKKRTAEDIIEDRY